MASKPEYTRVSLSADSLNDPSDRDDGPEPLDIRRKPRRFCQLSYILTFLLGFLAGIAVFAASTAIIAATTRAHAQKHTHEHVHVHDHSQPQDKPQEQQQTANVMKPGFVISPKTGEAKCGNSWQEAKRLGCHFDVMASRWYSDECFNAPLLTQMLEEVDFEWYADPQHTQPVSREVAISGEFEALWPLYDFHIMHCLYLWRRLHSAVVEHRHLDDDVYSFGHTVHCTRLIMNWPKGKNTTTIATSGIPYCRNTAL